MAGRPRKDGVEYFPHDVDLSKDEKVEALQIIYKNDGYAFYCKALERIYRGGGQVDISTVEMEEVFRCNCGIIREQWPAILEFSLRLNLFYKTPEGFLRSKGADKRLEFIEVERARQRRKKAALASKSGDSNDKTNLTGENSGEIGGESRLSPNYPPGKESKGKESKVKKDPPFIPQCFAGDDLFLQAWSGFLESRKKQRKSPTPRAVELLMEKLEVLSAGSPELAAKILDQSVEYSWQGVFPLREDYQPRNRNRSASDDSGYLQPDFRMEGMS